MVSTYQRVAAYIDGFNLYYGLRSKGWQRYYWVDMNLLVGKLLAPYATVGSHSILHYPSSWPSPATQTSRNDKTCT